MGSLPDRLHYDSVHDIATGVTVLTLRGVLDLGSAHLARSALAKSLADCPAAVVVDLSGVELGQPAALTVFPSTVRAWHPGLGVGGPDVAVVLCLAREGRRFVADLPVTDTTADAVAQAVVISGGLRRMSLALPPNADAPRQARDLVIRACAAWGIDRVSDEARLVASELVTNAVEHAGAGIEVELANREPYLHIRVRDASTALPANPELPGHRPKGRGLYLVDVYCGQWGAIRDDRGKVVWAILRTKPVGSG